MTCKSHTDGYDNSLLAGYCRSLEEGREPGNRFLMIQIPQVILDSFNRDIALKRGYYNFPPTGLQYLFEAVKDRDLEIEILDLNFELLKRIHQDPDFHHDQWPEILEEKLAEFRPSMVGVSCLFDAGIAPMLKSLEIIREQTDAIVIAGGVIATYETKNLLTDGGCHFVIAGEGENKLNFLLDHLSGGNKGTMATPGIYFWTRGEEHESVGASDIVDIRGDLIDSYQKVPIEEYYKYGSLNPFTRMRDAPYAPLQFARGCRAMCTFCAVRDFMGKGVRHRPVEDVLAEMTFLVEKRGVHHFEWLDDDPAYYRDEFKQILREITARDWDICWFSNNGVIASTIDEELLQLMCDSNSIGFKVGIESGNPDMLKKVKKPATHDKFRKLSEMLKNFPELFVGGNIIVGLPEEKFFQMMDSFKFMLETDYDWAAVTMCQSIRGATAFSDSGEYFESQMKTKGGNVVNFIPVRDSSKGRINADDSVLRGLDVFRVDPESEPSADQVREVWFAFNVICNYVFNKNLMSGGRADKFIYWVENAQKGYPTNPYMCLFLSLAYILRGDPGKAAELRAQAIEYSQSEYWRERFEAFGLDSIIDADPKNEQQIYDVLNGLQEKLTPAFEGWLKVGYGGIPDSTPRAVQA
jgi:tRNA A37 methylthiotransferase MiaB